MIPLQQPEQQLPEATTMGQQQPTRGNEGSVPRPNDVSPPPPPVTKSATNPTMTTIEDAIWNVVGLSSEEDHKNVNYDEEDNDPLLVPVVSFCQTFSKDENEDWPQEDGQQSASQPEHPSLASTELAQQHSQSQEQDQQQHGTPASQKHRKHAPHQSLENVPVDLDEFPSLYKEDIEGGEDEDADVKKKRAEGGIPTTIFTTPYDDLSTIANDTIGNTVKPNDLVDLSNVDPRLVALWQQQRQLQQLQLLQQQQQLQQSQHTSSEQPPSTTSQYSQQQQFSSLFGNDTHIGSLPHSKLPPQLEFDTETATPTSMAASGIYSNNNPKSTNPSSALFSLNSSTGGYEVSQQQYQLQQLRQGEGLMNQSVYTAEEEERRKRKKKRNCYLLVAGLIIGPIISAIIVGVTVAIVLGKNDNGTTVNNLSGSDGGGADDDGDGVPTPTSITTITTPTISPTTKPIVVLPPISKEEKELAEDDFFNMLGNGYPELLAVFLQENSSSSIQYQAMDWITSHSNYFELSKSRIVQRYALAVLAFSFPSLPGANTNSEWLNPNTNECDWYSKAATPCDNNNMYVRLNLKNVKGLEGGKLPNELSLLSNSLQMINLQGISLKGTIPTSVGVLTQLERLQLTNNQLTGRIATELGLLSTNLVVIGIGRNQFTGSIPTQIANLVKVNTIGFEHNSFTGTIPNQIGTNMVELRHLYMDYNALTGTIPNTLWNLQQLKEVNFSYNDLSGTVQCTEIESNTHLQTSLVKLVADCIEEVECTCCTECY